MSTIDDLRATLEREATYDDTERHARPIAVRARIRVARRRRLGAVAAATVVALVVATGTIGALRSPGAPEPVGPALGDIQVPARIVVAGFPYRLADTVVAGADGSFDLDAPTPGDQRVVALVAAGLGSGVATLWTQRAMALARVSGDEQLSTPVTTAEDLTVAYGDAPATARSELAVYEPTGELAPGPAADGVVFVQQYGDRELVDAAFARAGEDATVDAPDTVGDLAVSAYCHSATPDLWLHPMSPSGGSLPCSDLDTVDNDALAAARAGDRSLTAYVTQGRNGPRARGVDVTFGVALYRLAVAPTPVLGSELPTRIDEDGRTWQLEEVVDPHGAADHEIDTAAGDVYVIWAYDGAVSGEATWRGAYDHAHTAWNNGNDAYPGWGTLGVLLHGDRYDVEMKLKGPAPESRLVVYRPV